MKKTLAYGILLISMATMSLYANNQEDTGLTFSNSSSKEKIYKWVDKTGHVSYGDVRPNETFMERQLSIFNLPVDGKNQMVIENLGRVKAANSKNQ